MISDSIILPKSNASTNFVKEDEKKGKKAYRLQKINRIKVSIQKIKKEINEQKKDRKVG